jgi:alpha-1,2-mannosyltransferase
MSAMQPTAVADPEVRRPVLTAWLPGLALFVVSFVVYAKTIAHTVISLDVWSAEFGSWHLAHTGSPWIDGLRIPAFDGNPLRHQWVLEAANGHTVIERFPGVIAASLPAYWIAHPASMTTRPAGLTAAAMMAAAVTLLFLALRRHLPQRHAGLAALVFGFTTPVWSVAANGMWPHTVTVFGICGMAWAASTGRWWWAGVFGGITLWGRMHAALIAAFLGVLVARRRRSPAIVVRMGTVGGVFLVLLLLWTHWMYGTWKPTASYDTGPFQAFAASHLFSVSNQLGLWVSPDRGILVWTPLVVLLVPALVRSWRDLPDWSQSLLWGGLAYTVLQGVLNHFGGGDVFYGYRLGLEMVASAAPALALSAPRMGALARQLVGPLVALQLLATWYGATHDRVWLAGDQAWHRNAFVESLHEGWPVVRLLTVVLVGALAGYAWRAREATDEPVQRGTLSSHSVP